MKNLVLIGMPGAGKSMVGVLLAKTLRKRFVDTDLLIQETTGRHLQEIIDTDGVDAFMKTEEEIVLRHTFHNTVIATGGSVVYSPKAMAHLKSDGIVVYLSVTFEEMTRRLRNITTRGIVLHPGQTLRDLYDERVPLYERYADITVDCTGEHFEEIVHLIIGAKNRFSGNSGRRPREKI